MDPKRRSELQQVTNSAFDVKVTTKHIDARYELNVCAQPVSTAQGDLRLFEIVPKSAHSGLPSFSGRWDHNTNTVDVDLVRNGAYEKNFKGHHTVTASPGVYTCDIHVSEGHIFTGSVAMDTELGLRL